MVHAVKACHVWQSLSGWKENRLSGIPATASEYPAGGERKPRTGQGPRDLRSEALTPRASDFAFGFKPYETTASGVGSAQFTVKSYGPAWYRKDSGSDHLAA